MSCVLGACVDWGLGVRSKGSRKGQRRFWTGAKGGRCWPLVVVADRQRRRGKKCKRSYLPRAWGLVDPAEANSVCSKFPRPLLHSRNPASNERWCSCS